MKKVHILLASLVVLLGGLGALLLQSLSTDDVRVGKNSAGTVQQVFPANQQDERSRHESAVSPFLSEAHSTGGQVLPGMEKAAPIPSKTEESRMDAPHSTATAEITPEDEALLALSQEVADPVPLGPEFDKEQTTPDDETQQAIALHEALYESPGTVLAQGQNGEPVGPLQIETYRVEEVVLPQPTQVKLHGEETTVHTALRVTVTGGPLTVGALPLVVWIDDTVLGFGRPSPDLSTISAVMFDRFLLHEGATVAVSYGVDGVKTELPEKLKFGVR